MARRYTRIMRVVPWAPPARRTRCITSTAAQRRPTVRKRFSRTRSAQTRRNGTCSTTWATFVVCTASPDMPGQGTRLAVLGQGTSSTKAFLSAISTGGGDFFYFFYSFFWEFEIETELPKETQKKTIFEREHRTNELLLHTQH